MWRNGRAVAGRALLSWAIRREGKQWIAFSMLCAGDDHGDRYQHYAGDIGARSARSMIVCDQVYAELCVYFASRRDCDDFLRDGEMRVEALSAGASFAASRAWRAYRKQGGQRTDYYHGTGVSTENCFRR